MIRFAINRQKLRNGLLVHVRSYGPMGYAIRWALNKWLKRICEQQQIPLQEVWGNHDAMIIMSAGKWYVAECKPGGAALTPLDEYEAAINARKKRRTEMKFYEGISVTREQEQDASDNWLREIQRTHYDYFAFPRLLYKALIGDWSDCSWGGWLGNIIRKIGDHASGLEWSNWCTQGNGKAYKDDPPGLDLWQTKNPTPMATEQVAGELPRKPGKKITLREITGEILISRETVEFDQLNIKLA